MYFLSSLRDSSSASFFFFQAKDGMRYSGVTGVQTWALPIFHRLFTGLVPEGGEQALRYACLLETAYRLGQQIFGLPLQNGRSEERRVGKECRSRWSPYH